MTRNDDITPEEISFDPVARLDRAARLTARNLTREGARSLVDMYYRWQEHRIALNNQVRAQLQGVDLAEEPDSTGVIEHFATEVTKLEKQMVGTLGEWAMARPEGEWAQSQISIGPVLSASLSAHSDIT